jgi:hypothetical protein
MISKVLRIVISIGFLIVALTFIDVGKLPALYKKMDVSVYIPFFLLLIVPVAILAQRWRLLLKSQSINPTYLRTFYVTYVGCFFNNFLPGALGGEVVKAIISAKGTDKKTAAVSTIILDHIIGLVGMLLMAGFVIIVSRRFGELAQPAIVIYLLLGGIFIFYLIYTSKNLRRFGIIEKMKSILPFKKQLKEADAALLSISRSRNLLLVCIFLSFVGQSAVIVATYGFAQALHIDNLRLYHVFVFAPIVWIVNAIPITIGGWGAGELAWIKLSSFASIEPNQAVALSLLVRFSTIIMTLPGAIILASGIARLDKKY